MSFSQDVKNEIISSGCESKNEQLSRIAGMICFGSRLVKTDGGVALRFSTENLKIARHLYVLLKKCLNIKSELKVHKNIKTIVCLVIISDSDSLTSLFRSIGVIRKKETIDDFANFKISPKIAMSVGEKKEFAKGVFLSGGSVISPTKNTHLEFVSPHLRLVREFEILLKTMGLSSKVVTRKNKYVMYFKNSDEIADLLTIFGAFDSLMEYHNVKIMKSMHNSVNRVMNCDNANMNKTLDAAFKQSQAIEKLMKAGVLENMSEQIREIARLRLEYKELSLTDLGNMLNPPLGKSGVNHRLRKIMEEAEKLK